MNNTYQNTDAVEQLEDARRAIEQQLAANRTLLKDANRRLRVIEKWTLEDFPNKPQELQAQQQVIDRIQADITDLEIDKKSLHRTRDDENEENIQAALMKVETEWLKDNSSAAYVIDDGTFTYVSDYSTTEEKQNVQVRQIEPPKFSEELAHQLGLRIWHLPPARVKDLFSRLGRTYQISRYSIDPQIWQGDRVYLPIKHMEQYFIDKVQLDSQYMSQSYSEYFDCLLHSLSGGREENKQHIERWILHKVKNYRKAVTTPDLVIVGHVGGNGKGILQAIIRLMFPASLSGKANSKTLNGNFNAIMLGKLIVFFDDQNTKEIPLEVVKQLAGADTMIFEKKGKDQYEGEKTHSSAWFSNTLPFKLTPSGQEGGVDRRFSVMRTNITFLESLRTHYQTVHNTEMTVEESKDMAEIVVSQFLLNRREIARWFKHLEARYPEVNEHYTLKPLHGEDYHYFLDRQHSSLDIIWRDLVMPELKQGGCVPLFVIKELLKHMENKEINDKTLITRLRDLGNQNRMEIDSSKVSVDISPRQAIFGKKRCNVIHIKGQLSANPEFDWSVVSSKAYSGPEHNGRYIDEENLLFGLNNGEETENDLDNHQNTVKPLVSGDFDN